MFEAGLVEAHFQVLRPVRGHGDERDRNRRLLRTGKIAFGVLGRLFDALERHPILTQIDARLPLKLLNDPANDPLVEILAPEMRIAVGRENLEDSFAHVEDRNIECPTAEVENCDARILLFPETISQRGRGRFIDDSQHLDAGDAARVLGCLPLGIIEVGRHGNHRLGDVAAVVILCSLPHLLHNHGRDFLRSEFASFGLDDRSSEVIFFYRKRNKLGLVLDLVIASPHETLGRIDRIPWISEGLPLGHFPDVKFAIRGKGND